MIKYVEDIIKEIDERDPVEITDSCATGKEFEKWLRLKDVENKDSEQVGCLIE